MVSFVILGAGGIANKFADAVSLVPEASVKAVASKSADRAHSFARQHRIPASYDSYEEMLEREKPDAAYIATTVNFHCELILLCIRHGVSVLCEKAMVMNSREAQSVFSQAKAAHVFVMEAMWSRFLPHILKAREWLQAGKIGSLEAVDASLGFQAPYDPANRFFSKRLGGGAARDLLVYCYELTTFFAGEEILETRVMHCSAETGADKTDLVALRYPSCLASLRASFSAYGSKEILVLYGSKGKIEIPAPHYGNECTLFTADGLTEHFQQTVENGFVYEIQEVLACLKAGVLESSIVPWKLTENCAKLFDEI